MYRTEKIKVSIIHYNKRNRPFKAVYNGGDFVEIFQVDFFIHKIHIDDFLDEYWWEKRPHHNKAYDN